MQYTSVDKPPLSFFLCPATDYIVNYFHAIRWLLQTAHSSDMRLGLQWRGVCMYVEL